MERIEIEKMIKEHLAHKETGDKSVISGLFHSFKEDMLVALTEIKVKISELSEHQKVANGRTGKLEDKVSELQKVDATILERMSNNKEIVDNRGKMLWDIVKYVLIAIIGATITYTIK